jgi:hypothetical protein
VAATEAGRAIPAMRHVALEWRSLIPQAPGSGRKPNGLPIMSTAPRAIIIQGITRSGRAFRPSDWAERLCGVLSTFGDDRQMRYSSFVHPVLMDGVRCVLVDIELRRVEPRALRFLLDFAGDNELVVIDPSLPEAEGDFCPVPGVDLGAAGRQPPGGKPG